jgi:flagellar motor switch protein FliN/FliY
MAADLENVSVDISVDLGRRELTIDEAQKIQTSDTIEFDKLAGEVFDILINGRAFAEGEIVVVTGLMAVRITRLIDYRAVT